MKVVFVSNYMVIHQKPFCDAMISLIGADNFAFVACKPLENYRSATGYLDMNNAPCVIKAYESKESLARAQEITIQADVAIITIGYPEWLKLRARREGGLTFVYLERLLKIGLWYRFFAYPKYLQAWRNVLSYRNDERFHMLCASAFGSSDLALFTPKFPLDRCWKWGYFPDAAASEIVHRMETPTDCVSILWVARLIGWKRPLLPLKLAERLKSDGYVFHLSLIGGGPLKNKIDKYINKHNLSKCVEVVGVVPNKKVRSYMHHSNILLCTSTRREGWGAVLNEGMSEGCIPVASSMIGSVPYLIKDGINGCVFVDGNINSLVKKVEWLLDNHENWGTMQTNAERTILEIWNARKAACNFLALSRDLIAGNSGKIITIGPGSHAEIIQDSWFKNQAESKEQA
jgi:glycosyltransferase involved in cell wall biosynthesis